MRLALVGAVSLTALTAACSPALALDNLGDAYGAPQRFSQTPYKINGGVNPLMDVQRWGYFKTVQEFGAVADATGVSGSGTDNTQAFKTAFGTPSTDVFIPCGQYRYTPFVPIAGNVRIRGQGKWCTILWLDDATAASDGLTINNGNATAVATGQEIEDVTLLHVYNGAPTAGALLHITNTYGQHFRNVNIGNWTQRWAFDNVKIDCFGSQQITNDIHFTNAYFAGAVHDDAFLSCNTTSTAIADIWFDGKSYFASATHAGIEFLGSVGWTHLENPDFDNNAGTGMLGSLGNGTQGNFAWITTANAHFEANGDDWNFTQVGNAAVDSSRFLTGPGITCTLCQDGETSNNTYTANAGMQLNGVTGWKEKGSLSSTTNASRQGLIIVSPSGSTPSTQLDLDVTFLFTGVPAVYFAGAANPAATVKLNVLAAQGSCFAGTNVSMASFTYRCDGPNGGYSRQVPLTVANLPASPGSGATASVSDATACSTRFGALTGGGSTWCPVVYNGSAWVAQ